MTGPVDPSPIGTLTAYRSWCTAHGMPPDAHDSLAAWLRELVLPRHQLVAAAESVARQLFGARAPALLEALEAAGVLGRKCRHCVHDEHVGMCTGRNGGTAYPCPCIHSCGGLS